jgi:hypothetical protein
MKREREIYRMGASRSLKIEEWEWARYNNYVRP